MKPINLKMEKAKKYYQPIPPYNGYGTEEDSLGSVYYLLPKPPKKDLNKMFKSDQNILRYEARLISKNREDNDQKFIISFFCGDDTVQVYHSTAVNSGIVGGKLIQRGQHKNPITGKCYTDKDFQIGEIITISVYNFQILRCDEFTWNYMQENLNLYPKSNWEYIVDRIRKCSPFQ